MMFTVQTITSALSANIIKLRAPKRPPLLFALHTYYAIFIKLLASEIVSAFAPFGLSPLKKLVGAPSNEKLREELQLLGQGSIRAQLGIRNFLEGDLFSWYLDAWEPDFEDELPSGHSRSASIRHGLFSRIAGLFMRFTPHPFRIPGFIQRRQGKDAKTQNQRRRIHHPQRNR